MTESQGASRDVKDADDVEVVKDADDVEVVKDADDVEALMRRVFAMAGPGSRCAVMKVCSACGLRLNTRRSRCPLDGQSLRTQAPDTEMAIPIPGADGGDTGGVTARPDHPDAQAQLELAQGRLSRDRATLDREIGALQTSVRAAELATIARCREVSQSPSSDNAGAERDWGRQRHGLMACVAELDICQGQLAAALSRRQDLEFQIEQLRARLASLPTGPAATGRRRG